MVSRLVSGPDMTRLVKLSLPNLACMQMSSEPAYALVRSSLAELDMLWFLPFCSSTVVCLNK